MSTTTRVTAISEPVADRGNVLIGLLWSLTTVALITVLLRFFLRARLRRFGWDDIFMLLAMVCFIAWSVVLTIYCFHGGEQHISSVTPKGPDNLALVLFLNWLSQVFGIMGVGAGKVSVSALLLGIIRDTELRWQKMYLWSVTIGLASAVAVSCSILTFAQCSPAAALWDKRVKGDCMDPHVMSSYGIWTGSFNTFADASLAVIPATIFWRIHTGITEKMQLTVIFGLNILTSICSGLKTQYLAQLANRDDQTWATFDIFAWVTAELCLMIVCGTVPTLYPVFRWLRSILRLGSSTGGSADKGSEPGARASSAQKSKSGTELSRLDYKNAKTKTTAERSQLPQSESQDHLFDDEGPAVRVGMIVKHSSRTSSASEGR